ncbi:MAG TPA: hypothetical protein VNU68_22135 [Verrucomicrobiae bacterium]|nr:hypothetical protein [Verrucomicrobiae bacterium]
MTLAKPALSLCSLWPSQRTTGSISLLLVGLSCILSEPSHATTIITNTRAEISFMAGLWEADSDQISALANAQFPQFSNDWQYVFPHRAISDDGDIHIDMAVDASGYGSTNNNSGASPIVAEIINASQSQLNQLTNLLTGSRAKTRGIFRFWTEHAGERHFEIHPVTELFNWNGSEFLLSNDYRPNINFVKDGETHSDSTLGRLLDGSQTITASMSADNERVTFTYPSPSVNYVQYNGVVVSSLLSDAVSPYFLFQTTLFLSPLGQQVVVRCRIVTNTVAAAIASTLASNQTVTINALTRTDMLSVSNQIASLGANQSKTFARPVEFITLGVTSKGTPTNSRPVVLAQWNFNSNPPDTDTATGTTVPARGAGLLTLVSVNGAFVSGSPNDITLDNSGLNTSVYPPQGTGNKTAGIQVKVGTSGKKNILITWDQRVSPTASGISRLQFSTNGTSFIDTPSPIFMNAAGEFESQTRSLVGLPGVEDNTNIAFRIVSEFQSTALGATNDFYVTASGSNYTTVGTVRFDLLTVTGEPIVPRLSSARFSTNGALQFDVSGASGSSYIAQASTNLVDWVCLKTNVSPFTFTDANAAMLPNRFYRAVYLP